MKEKRLIISTIIVCLVALSGLLTTYAIQNNKAKEYLNLGNKYLLEANYEQAIFQFEETLSINKRNIEARVNLAKAYTEINRTIKAEEILLEGIEITPNKEQLYDLLVDLYLRESKIDDALNILDKGYSKTKSKILEDKINKIKGELQIISDTNPIAVNIDTNIRLVIRGGSGQEIPVKANWSLLNEEIGTFSSQKGNTVTFKAKSKGMAKIVAKVGSIEKTMDIEVSDRALEGIGIIVVSNKGTIGDKVEFKAIGKDKSGKEIQINPTWSVESNIASIVSNEGDKVLLNYIKDGNTKITAKVGDITTYANITIEKKKYTLTTTVSGEGIINRSPNQREYTEDSNVKLQAIPKDGWAFKEWQGAISGSQNPVNINMNSAKNVKAVFTKLPTGGISGTIFDPSGSVITNVSFSKIRFVKNGIVVKEILPNQNGTYIANNLPPGKYRVDFCDISEGKPIDLGYRYSECISGQVNNNQNIYLYYFGLM